MRKHWYDYIWIISASYLLLGFVNIFFAWLGLICLFLPIILALTKYDKIYCNRFCGRGQLFALLGGPLGLSPKHTPPKFLRSKVFRYGFLSFFSIMFAVLLFNTWLVMAGNDLVTNVTLLWTISIPWEWALPSVYQTANITPWIAQFAYGFYSIMLTSTVLGIITLALFKPRTWCVYCPMGTATQLICKIKYRGESNEHT